MSQPVKNFWKSVAIFAAAALYALGLYVVRGVEKSVENNTASVNEVLRSCDVLRSRVDGLASTCERLDQQQRLTEGKASEANALIHAHLNDVRKGLTTQ